MTFLMFDTVTPSAVGRLASTSPDAVAGYTDGLYRDIAELARAYPNHRHLSIAVHPRDDADCLDVETGDASPDDVPGWVRRQHGRGVARPWVYANTSTWPAIKTALQAGGIGRGEIIKWRADFDGVAALLPDDDAKQFTNHWEGRNVDASIVRDDAFRLMREHVPPRYRSKPNARRRSVLAKIKPHPKITAAAGGGTGGVAVVALLAQAGVHLSAAEWSAISVALGLLAGWLRPARH